MVHEPGVSRDNRISAEGLQRLERQLQRGARIGQQVRQQWIRRYGQAAIDIMQKYDVETRATD